MTTLLGALVFFQMRRSWTILTGNSSAAVPPLPTSMTIIKIVLTATAIFAEIPLLIAIMNVATTKTTVLQMRGLVVITIAKRVSNMVTADTRNAIRSSKATIGIHREGDTAPVDERNMTLPHPHLNNSSSRPLGASL